MRSLTYYVACSVDGFIAGHNGSSQGFLKEGEHIADIVESFPETIPIHLRDVLDVRAENKWFDVVLMGRKTYENGWNAGVSNPYPHLKQYLFSQSLKESPDRNVELISEDPIGLVKHLKSEVGKDIWLCGGAQLAGLLFSAKLIDKLILKVNPFLMGSGIPLFSNSIEQPHLELTDSKIYTNGVLRLHYQVKA